MSGTVPRVTPRHRTILLSSSLSFADVPVDSKGRPGIEPLATLGRRAQLKDLAYERIKEAIVDLSLPPGSQLREASLAEQLGISKTPIREAFVRLEKDGLVETVPYRGAVVRDYTPSDLEEIFELRGLLEGHCAGLAASNMGDAGRKALKANLRDSKRALRAGDDRAVAEHLSAFDTIVQDQNTNLRVAELLEQLWCHVERIGLLSSTIPGRLKRSVEEHGRIIEAVIDGDAEVAERRMRTHIHSILVDQLKATEAR